jgi:hypothetical protein
MDDIVATGSYLVNPQSTILAEINETMRMGAPQAQVRGSAFKIFLGD